MRRVVGLFLLVAVFIVASWWWLGRPVPVTVNALGPNEKLECLSYAPFRGTQTPLDLSLHIEPSQIEEDLRRLVAVTGCVRTYSVHQGLDQVLPIAQKLGLKVLQGIWLGRDPEFNRKQIALAIETVKKYPDAVRAVVVGNEVLLRGEMSAGTLADTIREVKRQVLVPVTYADVWEFWLRNRDLMTAVDFVTIHILPYWEDIPISADHAADHVMAIRKEVGALLPGKEILIGEVGWPSAGRMREGARPSPSNQAQVLREVVAQARQGNFRVIVIEAFDAPWKRRFEGTVGGHWGLFDDAREQKFYWDRPVSDHPYWKWQATAGILLASVIFGSAFIAQKRVLGGETSTQFWTGIAIIAAISGTLLGITLDQAATESLGLGGLARSVALTAIAIVAPVVGAAALTANADVPIFARALGRRAQWPADRLTLLTGLMLVAVTLAAVYAALGLVFDPRYKDFPSAALTAAILPFALLSFVRGQGGGKRPLAEVAAAATLAVSAIYIAFNESFANWQAVWLSAALVVLAITLARVRAARS